MKHFLFSTLVFCLLLTTKTFAEGYMAILPLNAYYGNEGMTLNPKIEGRLSSNKTILSGGFDYMVRSGTANSLKKTASFPSCYNYYGGLSYVISKTSKDVKIPIMSVHSSDLQYIDRTSETYLGDGEWEKIRITGSEWFELHTPTGKYKYENHAMIHALRFGISGGRKIRDFGDFLSKSNIKLPLLKPNLNPTLADYNNSNIYGSTTQTRFYAGYELFQSITFENSKKPLNFSFSFDFLYLINEKLDENVYDLSSVYIITDKTHQTLMPKKIGCQGGIEMRIKSFFSKLVVGFEPGVGSFHSQAGIGFVF